MSTNTKRHEFFKTIMELKHPGIRPSSSEWRTLASMFAYGEYAREVTDKHLDEAIREYRKLLDEKETNA